MDKEILDSFEAKLQEALLRMCTSEGALEGVLLNTPDFEEKWNGGLGEAYVAEAVKEFNEYPEVALAWAGYLGMAVAVSWDKGMVRFLQDKYEDFHGQRGFDDMDEHITRDILKHPLSSEEARGIASLMYGCAATALSLIRHEGFESGSIEAYFVFIRCCKAIFLTGAAVQLKAMGYKMTKVNGLPS